MFKRFALFILMAAMLFAFAAMAEEAPAATEEPIRFAYTELEDGTLQIDKCLSALPEKLEVPAQIDGKLVTVIGAEMLLDDTQVKELVLPEGIVEIGAYAFKHSVITKVTLPKTLTAIREGAFYGCAELKTVMLPEGLTTLENYAFYCAGIDRTTLPKGVEKIGDWAFAGCTNMTSLTMQEGLIEIGVDAFTSSGVKQAQFPKSLRKIGDNAYYNCEVLQNVTFNQGLESIGAYAFSYSAIKGVKLYDGFTDLGEGAFSCCYELTTCVLPENGITVIPVDCFSESDLQKITIPHSVSVIEDGAFNGCKYMTSVRMSNRVTEIGKDAFRETALSQLTLPETLKTIGQRAFYSCKKLSTVVLPEGLETIGKQAFADGNLHNLTVPSTVTKIGSKAFQVVYTSGQYNVTIKCVACELDSDLFGDDAVYAQADGGDHNVKVIMHCYEGSTADETYLNEMAVRKKYMTE